MNESKQISGANVIAQHVVNQLSQMFSSPEWHAYLERTHQQFTVIAAQAAEASVQIAAQHITAMNIGTMLQRKVSELTEPITIIAQNAALLQQQLDDAAEIAMSHIQAFNDQVRKVDIEQLTTDLSKMIPAFPVLEQVAVASLRGEGNVYDETGGVVRIRAVISGDESVNTAGIRPLAQEIRLTRAQNTAIWAFIALIPTLVNLGLPEGQEISDRPYGELFIVMWQIVATVAMPILIEWSQANYEEIDE